MTICVLAETLTQLVEDVLAIELAPQLDPTTRQLLKGAMQAHPELIDHLAGEEST